MLVPLLVLTLLQNNVLLFWINSAYDACTKLSSSDLHPMSKRCWVSSSLTWFMEIQMLGPFVTWSLNTVSLNTRARRLRFQATQSSRRFSARRASFALKISSMKSAPLEPISIKWQRQFTRSSFPIPKTDGLARKAWLLTKVASLVIEETISMNFSKAFFKLFFWLTFFIFKSLNLNYNKISSPGRWSKIIFFFLDELSTWCFVFMCLFMFGQSMNFWPHCS